MIDDNSELKKKLPDIIQKIKNLKKSYEYASIILEDIQKWCWCIDTEDDNYIFALKIYADVLKQQQKTFNKMLLLDYIIKTHFK